VTEPVRVSEKIESQALRSVELFAGAGGLALGLDAAGFEPQLLVEQDELCEATLTANGEKGRSYTKGWKVEARSVSEVDFADVGEIELLSAGAPCQPFSHGGQRRGRADHRNLFPEVVRALHHLEPRAFVIENVRGLLFRDMEIFFKGLLRELKRPSFHYEPRPYGRAGRPNDEYRVFYKVLNAADFGLPQNRQRLFIVGLRPELAHLWKWPTPTHSRDALLAQLLAGSYWDRHRVPKAIREQVRETIPAAVRKRLEKNPPKRLPWVTVRDFLCGRPRPYTNAKTAKDPWHLFVPDARLYEKHTGSKLDAPAKTVKAGVHGCPGGEHIVVFDDGAHRYFTVRECGLLQGFPPDYAFAKMRTPAMRQIGNAVPPPIAEAVGKCLAEVLRG
jgi:DNA (cytosine-5)-methyltransferase 1